MYFMCDFTLQHQTWAQLDMRRSFEPQMKRSPYNNPLLPKTPNIYLNQTLNDPSSLAVCTALWDSKANVLGSHLISQRLICQHDGQTRDSQHLQKLITGLPGRARRCGASQMPRRAARPRSVEGWWIVRSTWRGAEAGTRGRAVSESACYTGRELKTGGFEFMGCILCGKRSWLCAWTSWNGWTNPPLRFPPLAPPRTLGPGAGNTLRRSWPAIDWGAAVFPRCEWSVLRLGRSDEGYNDKVMSSISQNSEYRFHTASFGVNASQFLFRVLFSVCEKSLCAFISG